MTRMVDRQAPQAGFRIGIDLGGTKIAAVAIDAAGVVGASRRIVTLAGDYEATAIAGEWGHNPLLPPKR